MVSLVSIILNLLNNNKIIKVRRLPPRKVLRAHQLGLTLGLLFALLAMFLNYSPYFTSLPWYTSPLLGLIFIVSTFFCGPFVLLVILFLLIFHSVSGFWATLHMLTQWYIWGYALGIIFSILYNDLVFLYTLSFNKNSVKIAFVFDTDAKFNIIKSPIKDEENDLLRGLDASRKLYNYQLLQPPKHPYTIAFVANPKILRRGGSSDDLDDYDTDPIIHNVELFLRSVDKALFSFERDEVLGRPEIWSRVRVIALFDESLASESGIKYGMVQPNQDAVEMDGVVAENLLDPMKLMKTNYENMLKKTGLKETDVQKYLEETDVIYALSASEEYDRSTAHFSDWIEDDEEDPHEVLVGQNFIFNPNPESGCLECTKNGEINVEACNRDGRFSCIHEYFSINPGRVALNVLGASIKTYIHEFGHAMSAAYHGAIVDEYFDRLEVKTNDEDVAEDPAFEEGAPFYVNRIERKKKGNGEVTPVHKIFANYNCTVFHSDLDHPSAEEEWLGYFPDRKTPHAACIMDRTYGAYRFDELLSNFMYDRLITKINRSLD